MPAKFTAGLAGNDLFSGFIDYVRADMGRVVHAGVTAAAEGLKADLRKNVITAGLGDRLGIAVGANIYPRDRKGSIDAAGYVFPRGKKALAIFTAWNEGTVIRAKNGVWRAIPTGPAGKGPRGTSSSPANFEDRTGIKLRFVRDPKNPKVAFLVGSSVSAKSGRGVRAATRGRLAQGRTAQDTIFFVLVGPTQNPKALDFATIAQTWADRVPSLIDRATPGNN